MNKIRRCQPLCGTFFEVEVASLQQNENILLECTRTALDLGAQVEKIFSPFDESSELSHFNRLAVGHKFVPSAKFYEGLKKAEFLFQETKGLFTVNKETSTLSFQIVSEKEVIKTSSGSLDMNGFIKGWIVDIVFESLKDQACDIVLVNGGGDLRYGYNAKTVEHPETLQIAIRGLEHKEASCLQVAHPCAVATSARYPYEYNHPREHELFFVDQNQNKGKEFYSATAVAPECWLADALTKVIPQDLKQAEFCAEKWNAQFYYKSQDQELCFDQSKILNFF